MANSLSSSSKRALPPVGGSVLPRAKGPDYLEQNCGHSTPCWVWQRFKDKHGYGKLSRPDMEARAHREYYIRAKGPIPDDKPCLDHLCRNPSCVNPDHLEAVTHIENLRRGIVPKITFDQAKEIRRRVAAGEPYAPIAAEYGVSEYVMWQIAEDITWREDPDAPRTPVRPERHCPECGVQITEGNRHKKFCCPQHRTRFNQRHANRRKAAA